MARQTFRANLGSADFPLISDHYGQTVVVGKQDIHYIRPNSFSGSLADKNIGIPQIIFAENVMPFANGYQSISYTMPIAAGAFTDADKAMYLKDASEAKTLFVPAGGQCRIYNSNTATWGSDPKTVPAGSFCSIAYLKGRTFVHFSEGTDFYEWDGSALPAATVSGLTPANILGIVSANSYLIAWDGDTIYWSSTLDPLDFVPSLSTGAGSEKPLGLRGQIKYCKPSVDGFIIYCESGAHYARYSNNIRFPWNFSPIPGSSGVRGDDTICDEVHETKTYLYGSDGLMSIDRTKAQLVFPTVTEFLAGIKRLEQYNSVTKVIETIEYTGALLVKLAFLGKRWLVISYGINDYTHALIYDVILERWGKVKITHVDAFEFFGSGGTGGSFVGVAWQDVPTDWNAQAAFAWNEFGPVLATGAGDETMPYKSIAFLKNNGEVHVVDFAHTSNNADAVLYLGRFQFIRDRLVTLQDVRCEEVGPNTSDKMDILTSYDGTNIDKVTEPMLVQNKGRLRVWQSRVTGYNHILRFKNNFRLNTVALRVMLNGSR